MGCHLHDNMDGTLSVIDQGQEALSDGPAVVVSRGRSRNKDPILSPHYPVYDGKGNRNVTWVPIEGAASDTQAAKATLPPMGRAGVARELWQYICSKIGEPLELPDHEAIAALLKSPCLRDLEDLLSPLSADLITKQVAGIIIYMTGTDARRECTACRRSTNRGPFSRCVTLVSPGPAVARLLGSYSRACANCIYHKAGALCSIKAFAGKMTPAARRESGREPFLLKEGSHATDDTTTIDASEKSILDQEFAASQSQALPSLRRRRAEEIADSDSSDAGPLTDSDSDDTKPLASRSGTVAVPRTAKPTHLPSPVASGSQHRHSRPLRDVSGKFLPRETAQVSRDNVQPPSLDTASLTRSDSQSKYREPADGPLAGNAMEAEDWELDEGRVKAPASNRHLGKVGTNGMFFQSLWPVCYFFLLFVDKLFARLIIMHVVMLL